MSGSRNTLDINLRGREYRVACAPEEREALKQALSYVDAKMEELAAKGNVGVERLAVMTALNIAHELLTLKTASGFDIGEFRRRIIDMESRLGEALAQQETLF
jgi:cell division protein ZapA